MLLIAALLLVSFALLVFSRIAETRRADSVFFVLAMIAWSVAAFLVWKDDSASIAILGFWIVSLAISDLIAIPIWRRRVVPPCIRVREQRSSVTYIITSVVVFVLISFVIYLLVSGSVRSFGMVLFTGLAPILIIFYLVLFLFEKTEICGNGIWLFGRLQPWENYASFSWTRKTEESIELRLVSKSWIGGSTRLMAPFEDREAVVHLLRANLPDLSV